MEAKPRPSQNGCSLMTPSCIGDLISNSNKWFHEIFNCYKCSRLGLLSFAYNFESHSTHHLDFALRINLTKRWCGKCLARLRMALASIRISNPQRRGIKHSETSRWAVSIYARLVRYDLTSKVKLIFSSKSMRKHNIFDVRRNSDHPNFRQQSQLLKHAESERPRHNTCDCDMCSYQNIFVFRDEDGVPNE